MSRGSLKRIIQFILFGNVFIALGAVLLIQSTFIQLHLTEYSLPYAALVFFATLFIYNLQRSFYSKNNGISSNSVRRQWIINHHGTIKKLAIIGFSGTLISLFFNPLNVIWYLSPLLVISIAYFFPVLKLRKYAILKLLTLASVWVLTTAVVPILLNDGVFYGKNVLHIMSRFCFMMAVCIPFDIRDLDIDTHEKISTLPQQIGESGARYLALGFMLCHLLWVVTAFEAHYLPIHLFIALMVAAITNSFFVVAAHSKRSEYFYVAGIDGTLIIQGMLLLIAEYLF